MENCTMEKALDIIVNTFHHYSTRVGNPDTLVKGEMKQLITKELPNFIKNAKDLQDVKHLMQELDTNQNGQVDFKEFSMMMARLTMATHEKMHENAPDKDHHSHGPGLEGKGGSSCGSGHGHGHSH
ncbi:protein S100-A9 [Monodelphis domestica]|uniref:Protein S100 n=1 Tax=Monodelphis domestica TaxID=13616 RepID=F7AJJ0_MONDO|nr:protein S100-A9 [Monodelphis domestica]